METLCIVMIVIFLFMGSFRAVFIPIAAVPIFLGRRILSAYFISMKRVPPRDSNW